ncbi:hypothetical protein [Cupriavidus alkaliphilus]|uniref:hypothetical protein n=1 Tax=Cupriavidus alkaliphilus TaxID=942866 RepID=UPI00339D2FAD
MTAEDRIRVAFFEAVEQMVLRRQRRDRWTSRAVFWAAVRYSARDEICAEAWPAAAQRWCALLAEAEREHLPPIPGQLEADTLGQHATCADKALAHMRDIVGGRPDGN